MAPGPAINGMARGTTPICSRLMYSDFSCLFCLSSPNLPLIIENAMLNKSRPPATRNESSEILNISKRSCPARSETIKITATAIFAVAAVLCFSSCVMCPVRDTKIGIIPTGLTAATKPKKNCKKMASSMVCMASVSERSLR